MIRLLTVLFLVQYVVAVTEPSLDEIINEIFGISGTVTEPSLDEIINKIFGISENEDDNSVSLPGCNDLEGKGRGCYECYFCNHTLIRDSRLKGGHVELQLKDSSCATTPVCCVTQQDLVNYRSSEACGKSNPDGKPRKRRSAPRAVLQGEFPWRAWVYKKNSRTPLCAATFVHEDTIALLTLASCVQGQSAEGLEVAFVKGGQRASVSRVIVHGSYKAGQDTNNIAILKLRSLESTPAWASPACLPLAPPSHAAPCLTTSDKDIRLNTVIPLRTACTESHEPPPDSLTCAVAPPGDYPPEKAAGLFCKEQHVTTPLFILHGLAINRQDDVATYVNVWHFTKWINQQLGLSQ